MLVDSHCHLDRLDLAPFDNQFENLIESTRQTGVGHILCVCIDLESYPSMLQQVESYPDISVSVGVHPNDRDRQEPSPEQLAELARHPKNVAIGETGLDYFRSDGDLDWQRDRFRRHISAAKQAHKPLIIHTRAAKADTIQIM
ncbi:MAG: TatD family hydrolase, partial [Sedimenticola sp.]|nr:TatD family hydrolase [Sedimenticola sp.]